MSKLSFRARALDPSKPLNIHVAEELPDLTEYSAINRAVPQMPSGMEKEEESEHHLQRAICTGLIIPTPEVFDIDSEFYDKNYPPNYKLSRQLIRMQPLGIEQDIPDYDIDSADEAWINTQTRRLDLNPLQFEEMMDRLEKSSGQTVVTLNEAKALLNQDDEISIAVYDYWLNKRLTTQHPLLLAVKTENRSGSAANNPYIAFRRRTEKMQTRKNRKNDEASYEKMLKLKRNLSRAVTILEMIKRREKTKREDLHLGIEIFEKRYQAKDFNGQLLAEFANIAVKSARPAFAPIYGNQYTQQQSNQNWPNSSSPYHGSGNHSSSHSGAANKRVDIDSNLLNKNGQKEKRPYKKRKHKNQREKLPYTGTGPAIESMLSSEEEEQSNNPMGQEAEDGGPFQFRRSNTSQYHKPLIHKTGNWPWTSKHENGLADKKYRFTLTSIRHPRPRCIGFARRRFGRGGRVILDRVSTGLDDFWSNLDYTIFDSENPPTTSKQHKDQVNKKIQVETDSTSVVIDLVTENNNSKHLENAVMSGNERTPKPLWSENIVIKSEQKPIDDFDNCLENKNNRDNISVSASSGAGIESPSTSSTPSIRTNNSQGINTTNQFRRPSAVADSTSLNVVPAPFGGLTNNAGLSSSYYASNNRRYLDMDITDGINVLPRKKSVCEDADNQLYTELFGDWLHFRPKTPDDDFDDRFINDFGEDMQQFAENTSLSVEIQRLCPSSQNDSSSILAVPDATDNLYQANPFSFDEIFDERATGATSMQDCSSSNENLNLSGDSLPELSLSMGENEENEKNFVNFLEDCAELVDLKDLPNPTFWNGLLDDSGGPLDILDDKKSGGDKVGYASELALCSSSNDDKSKATRKIICPRLTRVGHSSFSVTNFNVNENVFKKSCESDIPSVANANSVTVSTDAAACPTTSSATGTPADTKTLAVKKELSAVVEATEIKLEPADEILLGLNDSSAANKNHNFPVIKTEAANNLPIIAGTVLHRPIVHQQNIQLHPSQSTDNTLLISTPSRQARRFTTNGPTDNKSGLQQLILNRKIQMVAQQRSIDDDKDQKPKIEYVKFPTEFNVVTSNNMSALNASAITSKHNYSLPPQAAFHPQPITLIGQASPIQNKIIVNSATSHSGGNITIGSPMQDPSKMAPNIKLNLVPSMNVMQAGLMVDPKNLDKTTTILAPANQHHFHHSPQQQAQPIQTQQQQHSQAGQQQKVKIEKTMNMMLDTDRNRILYTNLKNNRGGQFIAQLNPKLVNILPIQHKNNIGNTVQGIVTPSSILNKNIQRVVASPGNAQNPTISSLRPIGGATIGSIVNTSVAGSTASVVISGTSGANVNSIAINAGTMVSSAMNAVDNNSDGTSATISNINMNNTNR